MKPAQLEHLKAVRAKYGEVPVLLGEINRKLECTPTEHLEQMYLDLDMKYLLGEEPQGEIESARDAVHALLERKRVQLGLDQDSTIGEDQ